MTSFREAYAKMAAPVLAAAAAATTTSGKPVEAPKEGPAAVAVGRAVASGIASPICVKDNKASRAAPPAAHLKIVVPPGRIRIGR